MSSAYTPELKEQAVALYRKSNASYTAAAKELDIDSESLSTWVKKADGVTEKHMDAMLVDDALRMAITRRQPKSSLIHHSGHSSQYRSLLLGKTMREHNITPSMGTISSPWDNDPTESFMGIIKQPLAIATVRMFTGRRGAWLVGHKRN